jgi:hypothetical protein
MAGVLNREMPVFVNSDRVFTIPKDLAAGDAGASGSGPADATEAEAPSATAAAQ